MFTRVKVKNLRIGLLILIFLVAIVLLGPQEQPDSNSYLSGSLLRVGLYPLILRLIGCISMGNRLVQVWIVIIIQNVIAVISIVLLAEHWIKKRGYSNLSSFITYFALLIPWFYELFDNILYVEGTVHINYTWITSTILTEGFTYSLFYLCIYELLLFSEGKKIKELFLLALYMLVLTFIRTQLLCLWPCAMIAIVLSARSKKIILFILGMCISLILYIPLKSVYMNVFNPQKYVTAYEIDLTTNVAFLSDIEDRYDMNQDEQYLFDYIYSCLEENEYLYNIQRQNKELWEVNQHRSKYFTISTYDYLNGVQEIGVDYFIRKYMVSQDRAIDMTVSTLNSIKKQLLINHLGEFIGMFIIRSIEGAMLTVLPNFSFSVYIFIVPYILFVLASIYVKDKHQKVWSALVLLGAICNIGGIGLFVSHAHRYLLFFMGLIYLTIYDGIFSENGIICSIINRIRISENKSTK